MSILQAYSEWLYKVPWGLYKAITYVKERYGNPTMILAENGMYIEFFKLYVVIIILHPYYGI